MVTLVLQTFSLAVAITALRHAFSVIMSHVMMLRVNFSDVTVLHSQWPLFKYRANLEIQINVLPPPCFTRRPDLIGFLTNAV